MKDNKIIIDEATKQILLRVNMIRYNLARIESNPSDFKYVKMVSEFIQEEAELIHMFSETMLQWKD